MNFKGKCAVKLMHGLPKLEPSRNVSSKVIKSQFMVQPQLEKVGHPWTRSMIRGSMKGGSIDPVNILMDPVHGPGPWTRSTEGVHVLCFPQFMTRPAHQNPVSDLQFN